MAEFKRILLAEDNADDLELTLAALEESGLAAQVAVVRDGSEALDYLYCRGSFAGRSTNNPVVLLLDVKMPRVGGIEVLRAVKSDAQLKTLPVVMLTSSREAGDVSQSYELGANAYVVKPVEFTHFAESMRYLGTFWATVNEPPPARAPGRQ